MWKPYMIECLSSVTHSWGPSGIKIIGLDEGNALGFAIDRGMIDTRNTPGWRAVEITWEEWHDKKAKAAK